jgi:5-methylcytosine-specific restriction endonuclease McrA
LLDTPNPLFHTPNPLFPKDSSKSTSAPKSSQRKPCPKAVKDAVWLKYFGYEMIGKCYVCGKPISYMDFEVGHNKPFTKGGEWNINNLRPICRTCNRSMGTMTIEAFKRKYFGSARAVSK